MIVLPTTALVGCCIISTGTIQPLVVVKGPDEASIVEEIKLSEPTAECSNTNHDGSKNVETKIHPVFFGAYDSIIFITFCSTLDNEKFRWETSAICMFPTRT
jgi:hypothetical protein